MKAVKKSATLLLMLMLVLSLSLAGCSKKEEGSSASPSEKASTAPSAEASKAPADSPSADPAKELKPYTVKLLYIGAAQKDEQKVEDAINKILEPKINAKLDIAPIDWGAWDNSTNLMIASREKFDIIFTAQWRFYATNVAKGAYLPLNDDSLKDVGNLIDKYGQGIKENLNPSFLSGSQINGKNYGIPTNKELAAQGGIVYRSDIADELGIDMSTVKTVQDLDAVLKVVKEKKPDITPLYFKEGETFNSHYMAQYDTLGDDGTPGMIFKNGTETKVVSKLDTDVYKANVKLARDFMKKGYINKDAAVATNSTQDAMKAGNVFMTVQSLKPGKDIEMANAINMVGKLKQIALTDATISTGDTAGAMLAVSSTSEDPARAMMVINLLHTDKDINNLINFGIDGVHYKKVADNVIEPGPDAANYSPGAAWMLGNQFLNYIWKTESPTKWDEFKAFNGQAKASPALGFTFDTSSVKTEVATCKDIMKEYDASLDTGSVDPDTALAKYVDKMKKAGMEKIITEKQTQLDAFLATKK
ncbi:ABC transporter substrate-binding protein [Gorillibacterium timonense]|uniref:ABC transporter substrate-binding protein n=1 Tax=Gorillibacterium timonense TaxID=1689269 RepID=UPI00071C2D6E|nr:ABC transporter substrate-binding protein [Gorillibacterium timonense]